MYCQFCTHLAHLSISKAPLRQTLPNIHDETFAKTVKGEKPFTIFAKSFIIDVSQGPNSIFESLFITFCLCLLLCILIVTCFYLLGKIPRSFCSKSSLNVPANVQTNAFSTTIIKRLMCKMCSKLMKKENEAMSETSFQWLFI